MLDSNSNNIWKRVFKFPLKHLKNKKEIVKLCGVEKLVHLRLVCLLAKFSPEWI